MNEWQGAKGWSGVVPRWAIEGVGFNDMRFAPLAVRDLNGNGRIDGGAELFGNRTVVGTGSAAHGFAALASLDGNADGQLNAQDSAWASLLLWKDLNGDGRTDAGELIGLDAAGVSSRGTGYSSSTGTDAQGNEHRQIGGFTRSDGSTGAMSQIGLSKAAFSQTLADGTRLDGEGSFVINGQTRTYTDAWLVENPIYRELASDIELSQEVAVLLGMNLSNSSQRGCAA